jgi:hypothetical protein
VSGDSIPTKADDPVLKMPAVIVYNKNMGGVNKNYSQLQSYKKTQ